MRVLITALVMVLVALQYRLWISEDGLRELRSLEAEIALQSERNGAWAERNAALEAEVRDLKEGSDAADERARSELGLVRADETFFQITSLGDAEQ